MIGAGDLDLFRFVDSPEEALQALQQDMRPHLEAPPATSPAFAKSTTCQSAGNRPRTPGSRAETAP